MNSHFAIWRWYGSSGSGNIWKIIATGLSAGKRLVGQTLVKQDSAYLANRIGGI